MWLCVGYFYVEVIVCCKGEHLHGESFKVLTLLDFECTTFA